jgi:hypothetical protein
LGSGSGSEQKEKKIFQSYLQARYKRHQRVLKSQKELEGWERLHVHMFYTELRKFEEKQFRKQSKNRKQFRFDFK